MDGAISSFSSESALPFHQRFQVGLRADALSTQSNLFEQILSLSVTPSRAEPETVAPDTPSANEDSSDDATATASTASDQDQSEEQDSTDPATVAATPAIPVVVDKPIEAKAQATDSISTAEEPTVAATEDSSTPVPDDATGAAPLDDATTLQVSDNSEAERSTAADEQTTPPSLLAAQAANVEATSGEQAQATETTQQETQPNLAPPTGERDSDSEATTSSEQQPGIAAEPEPEATPVDSRPSEDRHRDPQRPKWYARDPEAKPLENNSMSANDKRFATHDSADVATLASVGSDSFAGAVEPPAANSPANAAADATASAIDVIPTLPATASSVAPAKAAVAAATDGSTAETGRGSASSGVTGANEKAAAEPPKRVVREQTVDLSQQDRVRLVQRISRGFARLGPMGGVVNIKLHPPQLGSLNVQVQLEGRNMTAKLSTESAAARDAILESLPVLRSRLAEQGFEISQFQVEVGDNNTDAAMGGNQQQNTSEQFGDRQEQANVDYRRLATGDRQSPAVDREFPPEPSLLAWQTMTGIDLQA